MNTKKSGLSKEAALLFGGCSYLYLANGIMALMVGALQPYLRESYGLDYRLTGFLISAHSIGNLIASFISGLLPLYLGRKKSMLFLCSAGVAAFALILFTGNPWLLILAFFLTGINRGSISNFNNAVVTDIATGKAWAMNLLHSIYCIGAFLGPMLVILVTRNNSSRWTYVVLLELLLLIVQLPLLIKLQIPNNYPKKKKDLSSNWSFLRNPRYLVACCILFSYLCAEQAVNGWLIIYLQDSGIMSPGFSQIMASVLWLIMLLGRLSCAFLTARIKKSLFLLYSAIGYLAAFSLLLFSHSSSPAILGVIGTGLFMAGLYPTIIAQIGDIAAEYPLALSFLMAFGCCGSILMPSVIGMISQHVGIVGGMSVVIIAVVTTFLFIAVHTWQYRERRQG